MKKVLLSLFLSLGIFIAPFVHALDVTKAPTLKSSSTTSLTIEWDTVPDALWYYVYYGKTSWEKSWYDTQGVDLLEETTYTIEWLDEATTYFVAFTAVDINGDESLFSPELEEKTQWWENVKTFALESINATSQKEITLTFNTPLDDKEWAEREFLIMNNTTEEEAFVENSTIDEENPSKLVLSLDRKLVLWDSYSFTILSLVSKDGKNIESWIDALTKFQVPAKFEEEQPEVELNSAWANTEEKEENVNTEENSAGTSGKIISKDKVEKNTAVAAKKSNKLPQTWPDHILLIVIALLLGVVIFGYMRRKQNS